MCHNYDPIRKFLKLIFQNVYRKFLFFDFSNQIYCMSVIIFIYSLLVLSLPLLNYSHIKSHLTWWINTLSIKLAENDASYPFPFPIVLAIRILKDEEM